MLSCGFTKFARRNSYPALATRRVHCPVPAVLAPPERRACVAAPSGTAAYPCGAFRRGSSALHKHARAAELGAATRLANRAPGAAEPMTPSRKRCVPRRPEPCEARRGHPARLTLPWSPWRYHCHCSPPTALGQLRGGGSGACTTTTDQRGRVIRGGHRIEPHARPTTSRTSNRRKVEDTRVASLFQD